jgi:toxin YoeB
VKIVFADAAWEDYLHWQQSDPKVLKRVNEMIKECGRTPHKGTGKPEPLKGDFKGWWSRRITEKDRLVYRVEAKGADRTLQIAQCRFHY